PTAAAASEAVVSISVDAHRDSGPVARLTTVATTAAKDRTPPASPAEYPAETSSSGRNGCQADGMARRTNDSRKATCNRGTRKSRAVAVNGTLATTSPGGRRGSARPSATNIREWTAIRRNVYR